MVKLVADALVRVDWPETLRLPESERLVPEALASTVWPDTVRAVAEAVARVVCPVTKVGPDTVSAVAEAVVKYACPATVRPPVVEAFVKLPCVAKRVPVVVLLVKSEEVAKMFCEKRLRKRRALDPRDRVISVVGRMSPATLRSEREVVARVLVPRTLKSEVTVWFVEEELERVVCPATLRVPLSTVLPETVSADDIEKFVEEAFPKVSFPV